MTCTSCRKDSDTNDTLCDQCRNRTAHRLDDLLKLYAEAHSTLAPTKSSGLGVGGAEPTLGINMNALDWVSGKPILNVLHEWERLIREERQLARVAHIAPPRSRAHEISQAVDFQLRHLPFVATRPYAGDYVREIATLHATGSRAARRDRDTARRVHCPGVIDDQTCNAMLVIKSDNLNESTICRRCESNWTTARLVAVATSTPGNQTWLDVEAIARWCGLSDRQVRRIIVSHKLPKRGSLVELNAFIAARRSS